MTVLSNALQSCCLVLLYKRLTEKSWLPAQDVARQKSKSHLTLLVYVMLCEASWCHKQLVFGQKKARPCRNMTLLMVLYTCALMLKSSPTIARPQKCFQLFEWALKFLPIEGLCQDPIGSQFDNRGGKGSKLYQRRLLTPSKRQHWCFVSLRWNKMLAASSTLCMHKADQQSANLA